MASPVAVVTDTHALLFHAAGGGRLSKRAAALFRACERGELVIYVPVVVAWEVAMLVRAGKIDLGRSASAFFDDLFSQPGYQPVDLTLEQVALADQTALSGEPFDAVIVAAARSLDLPLITRDDAIERSGLVDVIW